MRKLVPAIPILSAALLLAGCPAFENHPCDGEWNFSQVTHGKQGSVTIMVIDSEIYSFHGTYYDPENEEELLSTAVYGNGIPLTPLYYNDENDGYWFEYPEGTRLSSGLDSFTGTLWPKTGAASCGFSSLGPTACSIQVDSGAFTPSE